MTAINHIATDKNTPNPGEKNPFTSIPRKMRRYNQFVVWKQFPKKKNEESKDERYKIY